MSCTQPAFPATRDGVRLALAAAQDELDEAQDAWRAGQPKHGRSADWTECRAEMMQLAAVVLRAVRSIDALERERLFGDIARRDEV